MAEALTTEATKAAIGAERTVGVPSKAAASDGREASSRVETFTAVKEAIAMARDPRADTGTATFPPIVSIVLAGPVIVNHYNTRVYNNGRLAVHPYRPAEWRRYHPNWHERYYYHGGHYFYDSAFAYPAVIDNEWGSIAALSGGVALLGAFNNDPYLFFAGTAGALYSFSRYDQDRYHGDRYGRLRAAYFARPYFYRSGVRYDRVVVTEGGTRYYRFRRH